MTITRQMLAVQALELRKRFLGKRAIPVYLLALIPLVLFFARFVAAQVFHWNVETNLAQDRVIYAVLFRTLILRFVVYFGCVAIFVPLFRGDILDRSLHYYFLVPMKRQTLTAAKYVSGLLAALVLFNGVTLATWTLLYLTVGPSTLLEQLLSGHGLFELSSYLLVASLACVGYGAVFLAAGVFFKNPIVPAVAILGWESINALLPPVLKKISVIHYLESLCPVSIPQDSGIAILADPASPWVAIPGILLLAALLVYVAAWRVKRLEILTGSSSTRPATIPGMTLANLDIRQQAELVLRLPAEERARFLLEAPKPMALVRALPDGDFYLTAREVGPQGALPLLALASASQIAHLLDLESWRRDRFDPGRCGAWVALLVEAGEATIKRFARTIDDETLILLFRLWANVKPLDIDHEEPTKGHGITEVGDERGFISPDGANLFAPERNEHALAVRRLAEAIYFDDRDRYLGIVRSALFELPSEVEETALHWRASRLEEHGYPTWDEALSIYAPPEKTPVPLAEPPGDRAALAAPRATLRVLGANALIVHGVDAMTPEDRERVLFGLMALANRVLVADGGDAGSVETHTRVIERAGAYVGLALDARGIRDGAAAGPVLAEVSVVELFREGYALAAGLQSRARLMLKTGWGLGHAKAEELIDAPLRARVKALLLARPLYVAFAEGEEAAAARDFKTRAEIDETKLTIELCDALGATLLTSRGVTAAGVLDEERRPFEDTPRFSTLLLTALVWHAMRNELRVDRLPTEIVADFLRTTASRRTADPGAPARAMDKFLEALEADAELSRRQAAALRAFGTTCLDRLAADCGNLDPGMPATPRVVGCLRLA